MLNGFLQFVEYQVDLSSTSARSNIVEYGVLVVYYQYYFLKLRLCTVPTSTGIIILLPYSYYFHYNIQYEYNN